MVGQHGQVWHPRPNVGTVLLGHYPGDLRDMSQIVNDPGGQKLPQRHRAEAGVLSEQVELCVGQVPGLEHPEVLGTQACELIEQGIVGALRSPCAVTEPIIRLEAPVGTLRENDARPGHPIGFLAIDQMADVVERTEGIWPLCTARPGRTDLPQERAQRCGRAFQNLDRQLEIEFHVSASRLRNGIDARCGESLGRGIVPPQPERPRPRTGRRSRQTPYRRSCGADPPAPFLPAASRYSKTRRARGGARSARSPTSLPAATRQPRRPPTRRDRPCAAQNVCGEAVGCGGLRTSLFALPSWWFGRLRIAWDPRRLPWLRWARLGRFGQFDWARFLSEWWQPHRSSLLVSGSLRPFALG